MTREVAVLGLDVGSGPFTEAGWSPPTVPPDSGDDGRPSPRHERPAIDAATLGVLLFIGAETMLFAGFIAAFLVFRLGAAVWPPPFQPRLPVEATAANTVVLLLSGYTMWRAVREAKREGHAGLVTRLSQTGLLGAIFLAVQGYEWVRLLEFGLTATSGVYGGTFYTLIGAHAVHVLGALIWLAIISIASARARYAAVPVFAIFWYFVVTLWPVLYALVYLA